MKNIFVQSATVVLVLLVASCQKMDRPPLGDYPQDSNPPGGPLKFYAAFDGTTSNPQFNAVDSIRANFPADNPLASVDGASGKAVQGATDKAINYPGANDFKNSTSITIAFWVNNSVNPRTELYFSLVDKDYWHASSAFMLVEHGAPDKVQLKFAIMDHWVEYIDNFNEPLLDGQWHHIAITYDETTSKPGIYFDGVEVPLPPGAISNFAGLGPLNLKNASNFVVAGWNKHAGLTGPTDSWISSFSGKMDQFRLYNKVLTPGEIQALYNSRL